MSLDIMLRVSVLIILSQKNKTMIKKYFYLTPLPNPLPEGEGALGGSQ